MANSAITQLIAENPVNKGLDYAFVDRLMTSLAQKHFPELQTVTKVRHLRHKRRAGKRHSTYIYTYYITGTDAQGAAMTKKLVYSSHSDGSRLKAYNMLKMFIAAGFNSSDSYRCMVPLEYLPEVQTLIYEAVPGKTLYQHMQKQQQPDALLDILHHAAAWIQKFHRFPLPSSVTAHIPKFDSFDFNWRAEELVPEVCAVDVGQSEKLSLFLDAFARTEKQLSSSFAQLVYGDLHPENVITETLTPNGLTMIDFTDVALGDQMRDIGSFLQQLQFMGMQFYTEPQVNMLRQRFLEYYFNQPFAAIPDTQLARINLYQAWNSLRGFVYFFFQESHRQESYGLLEDAWRYLNLTQERKHFFTITYGP